MMARWISKHCEKCFIVRICTCTTLLNTSNCIRHTHTTSFLDKLWHALTPALDRTVAVLRLALCVLSVITRRVCAEMEAKRDLRSLASVSTGAAKVRRDSFWE
jgi:hypothetical protein